MVHAGEKCIGIVKVDDGFTTKWYVGLGLGFDEEQDAQLIAERGAPFYPEVGGFFQPLEREPNAIPK